MKKLLTTLNSFSTGYYKFCRGLSLKITPKAFNVPKARDVVGVPFCIIFTILMIKFAIPSAVNFSYDAFAFNVLSKENTLTFGSAVEVEGSKDKYRVFACETFPCSAQKDSIEFRIRDSLYMDVATVFSSGNPYNPDSIAGVFLSERNECTVKYYGRRFKYLGFYPKIISATCQPAN